MSDEVNPSEDGDVLDTPDTPENPDGTEPELQGPDAPDAEQAEPEAEAAPDTRAKFTIINAPQSPVKLGINGRQMEFPVGKLIVMEDAELAAAVIAQLRNGDCTIVEG